MKTRLGLTIAVLGLAFLNISVATVRAEDYTYTATNGWSDFRDAEWTNHPARFYRIRSL